MGHKQTLHQRIVRLSGRHPNWTADDLARRVKCTHFYVRTVSARANLKLPRKPYQFRPVRQTEAAHESA